MTSFATSSLPTNDTLHTTNIQFLNPASITTYCQNRRSILQQDEDEIHVAKEDLLRRQKQVMLQGLWKLTKDVKNLTIQEFDETFGCDGIDMIQKMMLDGGVGMSGGNDGDDDNDDGGKKKRVRHVGGGGSAGSDGGASAASSMASASSSGLAFKTPAHRFGKGVPATRTARKGEKVIMHSVNGSPIDQYDHGELVVTAKKRRPNQGVVALPITIGIGAGNGECIDLADPSQRKKLGEEQKKQAMEQLVAMQEQMKNLMADW